MTDQLPLPINSDEQPGKLGPQAKSVLERSFEQLPMANLSRTPLKRWSFEDHARGAYFSATSEEGRFLPGPLGQDVYMALMYRLNERMQRRLVYPLDRTVTISFAELLDLLQLDRGGKTYTRLREALLDWYTLRIEALNLLPTKNGRFTKHEQHFRVFDDVEFVTPGVQRGDPTVTAETVVTVKVNERILKSMCDDRVTRFMPLDDYLQFDLPTSRRLYRYLMLHRHKVPKGRPPKSTLELPLGELKNYLPLATRAPSHLVRNLERVHQEFVDKKFLSAMPHIEEGGRSADDWTVTYTFASSEPPDAEIFLDARDEPHMPLLPPGEPEEQEATYLRETVYELLKLFGDNWSAGWYTQVAKTITADQLRAAMRDARDDLNQGMKLDHVRKEFSEQVKAYAAAMGKQLGRKSRKKP